MDYFLCVGIAHAVKKVVMFLLYILHTACQVVFEITCMMPIKNTVIPASRMVCAVESL